MNKVSNIVFLAAAALVIGGLVMGKVKEKQETTNTRPELEETEKVRPALSKEPEQPPSGEEKEHNPDESMDEVGEFDLSELDESEKNYTIEDRPTLSKYYRPEEIKETKEVGEKFIQSFHVFDGKQPMKHIEESKPYISDELYQKMAGEKGTIIRPTSTFFERTVKNIEMREPRHVSNEYITWEVRVLSEIKDEKGKKLRSDLTVYTLKFENIDGVYKVIDYVTNVVS